MSSIRTHNKGKERRAVAPIIATLLMVAIAVVGGILIFVFAQGFFSSSQVEGPTIESVSMLGYDARDVSDSTFLKNHAGNTITGSGSDTTTDNKISADDTIAFYFKNTGSQDLVINSFEIAGEAITFTSGTLAADTLPNQGEYVIIDGNSNSTKTTSVLPAGSETTILAGVIDSPLKTGRTYGVEITSGNSATFKFDFIAGIQKG